MDFQQRALARRAVLAASLAAGAAGAASSLDGWPAQTRYLANEAPFVVFGVTPTQLDRRSGQLLLTFVATDRLERVDVFPFVRSSPAAAAMLRKQVACGPRDAGSWDCVVPVGDLLDALAGAYGELGLRIEAHGELRERAAHSTVVVIVPVVGAAARPPAKKDRPGPRALSD